MTKVTLLELQPWQNCNARSRNYSQTGSSMRLCTQPPSLYHLSQIQCTVLWYPWMCVFFNDSAGVVSGC